MSVCHTDDPCKTAVWLWLLVLRGGGASHDYWLPPKVNPRSPSPNLDQARLVGTIPVILHAITITKYVIRVQYSPSHHHNMMIGVPRVTCYQGPLLQHNNHLYTRTTESQPATICYQLLTQEGRTNEICKSIMEFEELLPTRGIF